MSVMGRVNNISVGMANGAGLKPIPWVDKEHHGIIANAWKSEAYVGVYTLGVHPEEKLVNKRQRKFEYSGRYYWYAEDGGEVYFLAGGHGHLFDSMAEAKMAAERWFRAELEQYIPYVVAEEEDHRA